jgi:dipeptidyl aminopeptidase/acylaminoacyl peptidase
LHRFDFATGLPAAEPMVSTPGFDFTGRLVGNADADRLLGVRVETDAGQTVWFDPRLAALQEEADRRFPGMVTDLVCRRCGEPDMTVLAISWSAQHPGVFSVYTAADKRWRTLLARRSKIDASTMATMEFERFTARDGRSIPVWVTRPSEKVAPRDKPLPAVVLVHGGPWIRGAWWAWDPEVQFLASRGWVVIQPEFRGSTGFGAEHFRAGWRQWGQAMQDDVADATLWAARQGWIDPQRVCIAGASYGGYSTLMGLIRHRELYRCGVAWVAVTEPALLFRWSVDSDASEEWRRWGLPRLLGDPKADADLLAANSPLRRAAEIRRPLLLAMGAEDRRVPLEHGLKLRDAMRQAGQSVEWVQYDDEAHGWTTLQTRLDFYGRMERFLAQHLK